MKPLFVTLATMSLCLSLSSCSSEEESPSTTTSETATATTPTESTPPESTAPEGGTPPELPEGGTPPELPEGGTLPEGNGSQGAAPMNGAAPEGAMATLPPLPEGVELPDNFQTLTPEEQLEILEALGVEAPNITPQGQGTAPNP